MIFASYWFFAFALIVLSVYWLVWKPYARKLWLALACVVFHFHFAGPAGMLPVIFLAVTTFAAARSRNRSACVLAIALNVLALCFYKYTMFLTLQALGFVNPAWGQEAWSRTQALLPAAAPLAISFFTFEFVHYLYDVSHGAEPISHPLNFLLFAIFFPSLVAGPIKRFQHFLPALEQGVRIVDRSRLVSGFIRICVGLLKKLVLADNLTLWINSQIPRFEGIGISTRRLVFVGIGLRILMDFSGYSDIALGLAGALGITLPENFNWPYFATNIQQFWQRWHISLSTWIRDYVYVPLGGGAGGTGRTLLNGLFAFSLCGLWHGPEWHYVFWGVYHGAGLATYRIFHKRVGISLGVFGWALTQTFVFVGWMFFFYPVKDALHYMALMF